MARFALLVLALLLALPPVAAAHVQVLPTQAAPDDPVRWTVLVPGESDARTRSVELALPRDVLPFAYEDTPGWTRKLVLNPDQSVRAIRWTGRLARDGFVELAFLASTPSRPGTLAWRSLQTYDDGTTVRWIGPPGSEEPASFTRVSRDVARQNAGGEGSGEGGGATPAAPAAAAGGGGDGGGGSDTLALVLGGAGCLLGAAALFLALTGRRRAQAEKPEREAW